MHYQSLSGCRSKQISTLQRWRLSLRIVFISLVFALVAATFVNISYAQDVRSRSIIVRPIDQPDPIRFDVDVTIQGRSGTNARQYWIGEDVQISVRPSIDAYIYLFSINSFGRVERIFPNRFDSSGRDIFVRAGNTKYFPPRGADYRFTVAAPTGTDTVVAIASANPLRDASLRRFADYASGQVFANSDIGHAQFASILDGLSNDAFDQNQARGRSIIVQPVEPDTPLYAVGTVRFQVRR